MTHTIGLDVDGVLADFLGHTIATLRRNGFDCPDREGFTEWDIAPQLDPAAAVFIAKMWRRAGWCVSIPPLEGARAFVDEIRRRGFRVVFITTPMLGAPAWMEERRSWLVDVMGAADREIVFTHQKDLVRTDRLLDDKFENVKTRDGGILFLASYNERDAWGDRKYSAGSYDEFLKRIKGPLF